MRSRSVGTANLRSSPLIRSAKISADKRSALWICGARMLLLTNEVRHGAPTTSDMERERARAVACTGLVRRLPLHSDYDSRTEGAATRQPSGNALGKRHPIKTPALKRA